ncbi:MAG: preprotein translocase subunit SecE [Lachnospiraceae bacterium]|nr:preprotein translocase subunit SecE [Lachnospiraceae bacterium]
MAEKNEKTASKKAGKPSFWHGVKQEWNKIIWTPRETVAKETGLVVFISLVLGVIIALVDKGALELVNRLISL